MTATPGPLDMARNAARVLTNPADPEPGDAFMQAGHATMSAWALLSIAESLHTLASAPTTHPLQTVTLPPAAPSDLIRNVVGVRA